LNEVMATIGTSDMVFLTAGLGGGTGTGATPLLARTCKSKNILTVAIVTIPFAFEGKKRVKTAIRGIESLKKEVDSILVISNQRLVDTCDKQITCENSFKVVDEILSRAVKGVTDLIVNPGLINLDFADVRTVIENSGNALMGAGEASGENRAMMAANSALHHPLLSDIDITGAKNVLLNVTGGTDLTLEEVNIVAKEISSKVDPDANLIFGTALVPSMKGRLVVSLTITGVQYPDYYSMAQPMAEKAVEKLVAKSREKPAEKPSQGETWSSFIKKWW